MGKSLKRPIVGVPCCIKKIDNQVFHSVGGKYLEAIIWASGCIPLLIPALGDQIDASEWIEQIDGLYFTGSPSNVQPSRYGSEPLKANLLQDHARDNTTFPLINLSLAANIPLLAICRGFQELNVACGGTLHQEVANVPGKNDHRQKGNTLELQYAAAHSIEIVAGGILQHILGKNKTQVNSLHSQGIDQLGKNLTVEAYADDGLIEAVSVSQAPGFALAVQWHPEWQVMNNDDSIAIFAAFGAACKEYHENR